MACSDLTEGEIFQLAYQEYIWEKIMALIGFTTVIRGEH
jgi:hypothetical protein